MPNSQDSKIIVTPRSRNSKETADFQDYINSPEAKINRALKAGGSRPQRQPVVDTLPLEKFELASNTDTEHKFPNSSYHDDDNHIADTKEELKGDDTDTARDYGAVSLVDRNTPRINFAVWNHNEQVHPVTIVDSNSNINEDVIQ